MVYRSSVRKLSARARTQIRKAIIYIYISGSNPETVLYENSVGHAETLLQLAFFRFRASPSAFVASELALQSLWRRSVRRCWCSHSIFWRSAS